MSEGEKAAEVPWCQQPHLIIFELDFRADLAERFLGQCDSSRGENKRQKFRQAYFRSGQRAND